MMISVGEMLQNVRSFRSILSEAENHIRRVDGDEKFQERLGAKHE